MAAKKKKKKEKGKPGPKALHEGHALAMTPKIYLTLGEELKVKLIERSHEERITVTDLIRLFIAQELGIEFEPKPGYTKMSGGPNIQPVIGVEWKERVQQIRDKTGKSMPKLIREKVA